MRETTNTRGPRAMRTATLACTLAACAAVLLAYRGPLDDARDAVANERLQLRSDATTFAELARLRRDRPLLAARYATSFSGNAQARFIRELAWELRRRRVVLASSSATADQTALPGPGAYHSAFGASRLNLELRGTYRNIIAAIAGLSAGSELVRVEPASIHRAGTELSALVPVTVYDPSLPGPAAAGSSAGARE